mgnify:CR=1 FL=1
MTVSNPTAEERWLLANALEQVRSDVREERCRPPGALGRALVEHRGLTAWVLAWLAIRPMQRLGSESAERLVAAAPRGPSVHGPHFHPTVRATDAVHILATMVLTNFQDATHAS